MVEISGLMCLTGLQYCKEVELLKSYDILVYILEKMLLFVCLVVGIEENGRGWWFG